MKITWASLTLLISPVFDLTTAPAALLKFDVAYARFQSSNDGLKVILLNNCSMDVSSGIIVYDKSGAALATTASTSSDFIPANDQWRNEAVDLSAYIGQSNFQLAFVGFNDWGNNLYIDNVSLTTTPVHDVALVRCVAAKRRYLRKSNNSHPIDQKCRDVDKQRRSDNNYQRRIQHSNCYRP